MVYLNGVLKRIAQAHAWLVLVLLLAELNGSSDAKITYRRPIQVKSNAIGDQSVKEKTTDASKPIDVASPFTASMEALSEEVAALAVKEEIIEAIKARHMNKTLEELHSDGLLDRQVLEDEQVEADDIEQRARNQKTMLSSRSRNDNEHSNEQEHESDSHVEISLEQSDESELNAPSIDYNSTLTTATATSATTPSTTTTTAVSTTTTSSTTPSTTLKTSAAPKVNSNTPVPCTCGVFMTSQIKLGGPLGKPVIINELDRVFPCNAIGQKQCQTKCLETIVQHLPNSANILCATLDRDCRKERAYLFIKNCRNQWWNTNLAAGREYCCRNGQPYTCPLV